MYEEKRNKLTLKDVIVQLLIIVLFVFIMIWLFPTKGYLDNNYASDRDFSNMQSEIEVIYGRVFADNIESMKDAAQGYFTVERLPKKVGDSITLTLEEMLEKKLVLSFKDSNNETCNTTKSYVQLTKMDSEYQMKVQLSCSDYEDYIIVYMGCYDYCQDGICETSTKPTVTPTTKPSTEDKNPTPAVKTYEYQYRLVTQNEYSAWSDWSDWSTKVVVADTLTNVEKETKSVFQRYEYSNWGITGYKTVEYVEYEEQPTYTTTTQKVQTGTTTSTVQETVAVEVETLVDSKDAVTVTAPTTYSEWVDKGTKTTTNSTLPSMNSDKTIRYTLISKDKVLNCENSCVYDTIRVYKVEKRTAYVGATSQTCESYGSDYKLEDGKCNKYETKTVNQTVTKTVEVPVYENKTVKVQTGTVKVAVTKTKQESVYGYKTQKPIYEDVTYYRYRTRTQTSTASEIIKWSKSKNDKDLLNQGYSLTGNTREVA